jgi:TRAP-type C4-dicarboxylate transport system substrate-binding protein
MRRFSGAALAAAMSVCAAAPALAAERDLTFAIGLPPIHMWATVYEYVDENLESRTNDALGVEVYYGSLLNLKQSLTGLRDGIADSAMLVPGYHPAEMPQTNLMVDLAMLGEDAVVLAAAASEYVFTCPACLKESEDNGSIFIAMTANPAYMLQTVKPMVTLEDVKGKKIRSFSAFGRWVEYVGGIKMSLTANDIYDALSRGALDANMHPATELVGLNLKDVVKYVTRLPLGTYNGNQFNFNTKSWRSLSPELRRNMLDLFAEAAAKAAVEAQTQNDEILDVSAAKDGIEVLEPSPDLVAATKAFVAQDMAAMEQMALDNYGIKDAGARIATFKGLIEKWRGLIDGVDKTDVAAVTALYKQEIWDKVDAKTHGM